MTADAVIVKGGLMIFTSQKFLDRKRDVAVGAEGKRLPHTHALMRLLRLLLTMMLQHDHGSCAICR
jgi:hypothetical protein